MHKLAKFILDGWHEHKRALPPDIVPVLPVRDELIPENNITLKGEKAVVPNSSRATCIDLLQKCHM